MTNGVYVQVEGGVGDVFDDEAHLTETANDEITLVLWVG